MSVTDAVPVSMVDKASGVARFASLFEVIGYLGLIGAVAAGVAIGSQQTTIVTTTVLGRINSSTENQWPLGIAVGVGIAIGALLLIAFARALGLVAAYTVMRTVDADHLPPADGDGQGGEGSGDGTRNDNSARKDLPPDSETGGAG